MKDKQKLEHSLKQLEVIVEELNGKDVDVETGLAKFKEGVDLITFCRHELKAAENEFKKLRMELDQEEDKEEQ
ncbi:MAG: exodeoxyribonuclease VII small subunit [Candidatus Ryanbacteria bacterium CG10_big_fil_rev_8_21_14_0_10_43_42]|uniref:Exodeoxyribonuclease 7 small subunit n=1 Tax=Candidatus Ryanbacteria bacterium CG10_big_fil_rev_8_21_14_0_10_43_42 TaxID=1974864 RepID=A0A2M8KWU7_9BACT|nr:MAG: exodeoxyribonuclease VII small subunit [Candidatus Ryanbacteria bacterium CG10_big_fil_rev_8_21_14_0_10_43_42]